MGEGSIKYVSSRTITATRQQSRRKSRRQSSSRRFSKSSSINKLNSSDGDLLGGSESNHLDLMDASAPDCYTSTPKTTTTTTTRAGVSPAFMDNSHDDDGYNGHSDNVFDYTSKYVRTPPPPPASTHENHQPEHETLLQTSKDADPDDPLAKFENFQDEFEDEMDEIEMHAMSGRGDNGRPSFVNLAELEAKSKRRRRLRKCCMFASLFLLVGAVTGVIVWQVALKHKSKPIIQVVPEANKILKLWCAEELDLGPGQAVTFPLQVPEDCKVACNKAECCWNPKSDYECSDDTKQYCTGYKAPCEIMVHHITSDAEDTTASTTDDEGYPSVSGSGSATQVDVPAAPATLKTTCVPQGPSFVASSNCYNICAKGDCCWNTTSAMHCTATSKQTNCGPYEEFCSFFDEYPPQNNNDNSGSSGSSIPEAPAELNSACYSDYLAQYGHDSCEQMCNAAECCWKAGIVTCDSDSNCDAYLSPCSVLNSIVNNNNNNNGGSSAPVAEESGSSGTVTDSDNDPFPEAPSGLSVYCNPNEMEEISLHVCQQKCEPAACCWNTHVDNCDATVLPALCEPYYEACSILNELVSYPETNGANSYLKPSYTPAPAGTDTDTSDSGTNDAGTNTAADTNSVPEAPSDFGTRCAKDNIIGSSNGGDVLIQCEKECLAASCCWKPCAEGCSDNDRCDAYKDNCSIFAGLFGGDSTCSGNSGSSNGGSSSGESSTGGSTGSESVSGSSSSASNLPQAPSDLASTCAPEVLKTSVNGGQSIVACEKKCLPAACCWKTSTSLTCRGAPQCAAYMEPCATNLVAALVALEKGSSIAETAGTQDTEAAQAISKACNNQQAIFIKTNCEEACRAGNCCYDDAVACSTQVDCSIYEPCGILYRRNLRH